MSVKRLHRHYHVCCDICGEESDDGETFEEAVDIFKDNEGRVYKDGDGEWRHTCADCKEL